MRGITILDRYLVGQLFQTVLFAVVLFSIIWLAPETLFRLIQYVSNGEITWQQGVEMLCFHLPGVLQQAIPMAALLGSLFLFRRISLNSELVAMRSAGITPPRILLPVALVGLVWSGVHFWVQEKITPVTSPRLAALYRTNGLKNKTDNHFVYVEKKPSGALDKFFLIGQTQHAVTGLEPLKDFIILYYGVNPQGAVHVSRILRAPTGQWNEKRHVWELFDGIDYELDSDGVYRDIHRFREQWVNTSRYPLQLLQYGLKNPMDMDRHTLGRYVRLLEEGGQLQDVPFYVLRLYQKWSFPVASVVFVILGALLGMERARSNQSNGLLFGAVVIFLYTIAIPFSTNLGSMGWLPPLLVAWLPLGFATTLSLGLLRFRG